MLVFPFKFPQQIQQTLIWFKHVPLDNNLGLQDIELDIISACHKQGSFISIERLHSVNTYRQLKKRKLLQIIKQSKIEENHQQKVKHSKSSNQPKHHSHMLPDTIDRNSSSLDALIAIQTWHH